MSMQTVGPDPHGSLATGTGHSKEDAKHDDDASNRQITLTKEEQDIMDGKHGEVLAKLMKTVVIYGRLWR